MLFVWLGNVAIHAAQIKYGGGSSPHQPNLRFSMKPIDNNNNNNNNNNKEISPSKVLQTGAGFRTSITQNGINYLESVGKSFLQQALANLQIQDQSGDSDILPPFLRLLVF